MQTTEQWECTDRDTMQHRRKTDEHTYEFIQMIWLDTVPKSDKEYAVTHATVDMTDMSEHDIELAISGYHSSIKEMEESYGMPISELEDIVAECYFESDCQVNGYVLNEQDLTKEEATAFIKDFIKE